MAYFDANDPIRKQLEERFTNTGLGPTITVDSVTGETSLGVKKNPTARDWQKAYEGYISKGGSPLTTPTNLSATRMYQHPVFKSRGMSYYATEPYSASFMREVQKAAAGETAPATTYSPATTTRQFTDQYQDTAGGGIGTENVDPFTAPEGAYDAGYDYAGMTMAEHEAALAEGDEGFSRPLQGGDYFADRGLTPASSDPFASTKQMSADIQQQDLWNYAAGNISETMGGLLNNGEEALKSVATSAIQSYAINQVFGPGVGTALTIGSKLVDWPATQINKWGEGEDTGNPTQIAGWNSQGIGIDKNGQAVLANGMYQYKSFADWMANFGDTYVQDPSIKGVIDPGDEGDWSNLPPDRTTPPLPDELSWGTPPSVPTTSYPPDHSSVVTPPGAPPVSGLVQVEKQPGEGIPGKGRGTQDTWYDPNIQPLDDRNYNWGSKTMGQHPSDRTGPIAVTPSVELPTGLEDQGISPPTTPFAGRSRIDPTKWTDYYEMYKSAADIQANIQSGAHYGMYGNDYANSSWTSLDPSYSSDYYDPGMSDAIDAHTLGTGATHGYQSYQHSDFYTPGVPPTPFTRGITPVDEDSAGGAPSVTETMGGGMGGDSGAEDQGYGGADAGGGGMGGDSGAEDQGYGGADAGGGGMGGDDDESSQGMW